MQQIYKPRKPTSFLCLAKAFSCRTVVLGEGGQRLFCSPHLYLGHSETHLWRAAMSLLTLQMNPAAATAAPWGTGMIYVALFQNNWLPMDWNEGASLAVVCIPWLSRHQPWAEPLLEVGKLWVPAHVWAPPAMLRVPFPSTGHSRPGGQPAHSSRAGLSGLRR